MIFKGRTKSCYKVRVRADITVCLFLICRGKVADLKERFVINVTSSKSVTKMLGHCTT